MATATATTREASARGEVAMEVREVRAALLEVGTVTPASPISATLGTLKESAAAFAEFALGFL